MKQHEKKCLLCPSPAFSRNLCKLCYMSELRLGRLARYKRILTPVSIENRVKKTPTCWLWTGDKTTFGYGCVTTGKGETRRRTQAHRYVYELLVGKIPPGKIIMHSCDNPPCVNPAHLRVGTVAENQTDMQAKRRSPRGLRHWNGKLSNAQVRAIRISSDAQAVLAKRYGVDQSHICNIRRKKSRVHA